MEAMNVLTSCVIILIICFVSRITISRPSPAGLNLCRIAPYFPKAVTMTLRNTPQPVHTSPIQRNTLQELKSDSTPFVLWRLSDKSRASSLADVRLLVSFLRCCRCRGISFSHFVRDPQIQSIRRNTTTRRFKSKRTTGEYEMRIFTGCNATFVSFPFHCKAIRIRATAFVSNAGLLYTRAQGIFKESNAEARKTASQTNVLSIAGEHLSPRSDVAAI